MRLFTTLVVVATSALLPGCCNIARYLCGPDESDWVSERYDTPAATVATFREALRRGNAEAVRVALSEGLQQRLGIPASLEAAIAWERLQEEFPGIHVLGHAEVAPIEMIAPDYARTVLSVAGRSVELGISRQSYWEISWVYEEDPYALEANGQYVQTIRSFADVEADPDGFESRLVVTFPPVPVALDVSSIQRAAVGFLWKIDRLEQVTSGPGSTENPLGGG